MKMHQTEKTVVAPRKASTVILIRNHNTGFEVFLLRRHEENVFMGGNFVFPGGKLDKSDFEPELLAATYGIKEDEAEALLETKDSDVPALAYWIAAIRELFEEAGVLLAYTEEGNLLSFNESEKKRFAMHREFLERGSKTFLQIIKEENLILALDRLHYYAHWITPVARKIRFDTRFFIALHVDGQEAMADRRENTQGIWMSPLDALNENINGTIALSPPALITLEELSKFKSASALLNSIPYTKKSPILPILIDPGGDEVLIFPWDPEYELFRDGKISKPIDNGSFCGLEGNTTRLILKDGRLLPYAKKSLI